MKRYHNEASRPRQRIMSRISVSDFLRHYNPLAPLPICSTISQHGFLYGLKRYLKDDSYNMVQNVDSPYRIEVGEDGLPCVNASGLIKLLARPTGIQRRMRSEHSRRFLSVFRKWEEQSTSNDENEDNNASPTMGLLQLIPVEIRFMIFSFVEDIVDLCCLSSTHRTLLELGQEVFKRRFCALSPEWSWIGHRIICFDRGIYPDTAPKGLYTEAEVTEITRWVQEHDPEELGRGADLRYYYGMREGGGELDTDKNLSMISSRKSMDALTERVERALKAGLGNEWTKADSARIDALFHMPINYVFTYYATQPWVIYNLSKGEYIRADAFFPPKEGTAIYDALALTEYKTGLGEILMSRIIWADHGPYSDRWVHDLPSWAGDRFEIAPLDCKPTLDSTVNNGIWADVSAASRNLGCYVISGTVIEGKTYVTAR
ncbi:hypothetical protein BXZ70DRAFT_937120 [Cristinia sonorae]|uniref:F-box domain-containing protein n=1 Tax=Cristinia sonorae TaxID=1940300 RepID=A0A8K0URG0_9AGAR|nr:hypothetical protein BXZ70DRAFT_937120 [Cristinia sonorae]